MRVVDTVSSLIKSTTAARLIVSAVEAGLRLGNRLRRGGRAGLALTRMSELSHGVKPIKSRLTSASAGFD